MYYSDMERGIFLLRPNRFVAHVLVNGKETVCHVKNTGRCRELLVPGCTVYLQHHDAPGRKTAYSLIAVQKGDRLVNMDSQAPNRAVKEWLERQRAVWDITDIYPERKYGASRFDFYLQGKERCAYMEVKGVTLEENGAALFPDAPTQRGVKHVYELCECIKDGFDAYLVFVIQMKGVRYFSPNTKTHPAFGEALRYAEACGVQILAFDCDVTPDTMSIASPVQVCLP